MDLLKMNRQWEENFRFNFPFKRYYFKYLADHIEKRQITELSGLRRTGKTTLFFQLINELIDRGVDRYQIWYYTFDLDEQNLEELLEKFEIKTGKSIKSDHIYIFLDEIQKLENFASQLKVFYDLYPNLKFFISGSTSLFIKKKTGESLAGRLMPFFLPVLTFREYLEFTGRDDILKRPVLFQSELDKAYEQYWGCQFIETVKMADQQDRTAYYDTIIRKIIFEDIPQIETVEFPEVLYKIMKIIANHPGMYLNYDHLGADLKISTKTISKYVKLLEDGFLIKMLYSYSRNQLTSERKLKRAYLSSVSFAQTLSSDQKVGLLAENAVISQIDYRFFWRDTYKNEVDFIAIEKGKPVPIEVKFKTNVSNSDLKSLFLFAGKFKPDRCILLLKNEKEDQIEYRGLPIQQKNMSRFMLNIIDNEKL